MVVEEVEVEVALAADEVALTVVAAALLAITLELKAADDATTTLLEAGMLSVTAALLEATALETTLLVATGELVASISVIVAAELVVEAPTEAKGQ